LQDIEFILVLIEPEKLISSAPIALNNYTFTETYHIKDPNLEKLADEFDQIDFCKIPHIP
jgi:hypothetical protein